MTAVPKFLPVSDTGYLERNHLDVFPVMLRMMLRMMLLDSFVASVVKSLFMMATRLSRGRKNGKNQ